MRNDPFATLGADRDAAANDLGKAFSGALARGVPMTQARHAFDSLRNPTSREAMSILAVTLAPNYRAITSVNDEDAAVEASELVVGAISAALADLETHVRSDAVMPTDRIARDLKDYVPAPMEELEP